MKIEVLPWDSNFFNLKIGKVIIDNPIDFDVHEFLLQANLGFDLIYVISNFKVLEERVTSMCNLHLTDVLVTMSKVFDKSCYINDEHSYDFRTSFNQIELEQCYEIAEQVASVSRFYIEPLVGVDLTKKLYRKWIDNAINGSFSDGIFVEKINENIVGINLIKTSNEERIGKFTLTAIHHDYNRLGLGSKVWNQAFNYWATNSNIDKVLTTFSFQNKESLNFHLKLGFNKVEDLKYIYHFRKKI